MKNFFFFVSFIISLTVGAADPLKHVQLASEKNYLRALISDEQKHNDRVENTAEFESITRNILLAPAYRPENQMAFNLPVFLVPEAAVTILKTKAVDETIYRDKDSQSVRFFVHPQSINAFWPSLKSAKSEAGWSGTPTSSYRSILAWNQDGEIHSIKLSLDTEIGAISRMLSRAQIERATVTSMALQKTTQENYARQGIHFIDEPLSIYFNEFQYGYTLRENPKMQTGSKLVPLFALYAKRVHGESLLQSLIDKSGLSAKEYVFENLVRPLVQQTLFLGFTEGLVGAPHEQNVLVELKKGKLTRNFYYRDLGSFHINKNLRQLAGKNTDFIPQTFLPENLRGTKNGFIQSIQDYLLNSNFFALVRGLRPGQMSDQWIEKSVLKVIQEELEKQTGKKTSTWLGAKNAVSNYINRQQCALLFH